MAGGLCHLANASDAGDALWTVTIAATLVPLTWSVARALLHGDAGVDVIALLAMAGALIGGELLAGAVIAVMLAGGNALEADADGRARRELTALLRRAPQIAHRHDGERWVEIPVETVAPADVLLVRAGELVPVDGVVQSERASIDAAAITGEALPIAVARGQAVRSGTANAGDAFELRATRGAADSSYAALVRLVRAAEREKPPFTRLADRYALIFLPVALTLAGLAWALSGEAVRALAVLVVATPCPLILAAPIALVSGLSRAAAEGIVLKGGTALERLGSARTVLLDKTGTLTRGQPAVERVLAYDGRSDDELLTLAASVDQLSAHVLADGIVHDAERRGLTLPAPHDAREQPGDGIVAQVDGRRVGVGGRAWLVAQGFHATNGSAAVGTAAASSAAASARSVARAASVREPPHAPPGRALVHVGVGDQLAGVLVMADRLRPDAARLVQDLHAAGVRQVAMVTGDVAAVAEAVAEQVGLDRVYAEQSPQQKLAVVRAARERPELRPVVMVGDGVNDAPALALADVGIALAGESRTVSSEAADAVITVDRIDRVAEAVRIGRRTMRIARQSVIAGIGLSVAAMVVAAFGYLPPVAGALLQEAIDVAVILNALRALRP
ncbi:heavy metal translocating P-type ATPase [Conexibacter sp. CPCC 206217]|uniref:heavy metal translocating P-type ATPase n=1 Tax=Conexibacter sp. CPCC 206217 TaxID=3064574 RepID=UPI00271D8839|nr:heavy metal translocating P-type ATPase [Conexibacter sp. CPCC 206217]MDO8212552.1 heavy metal translocating P-type ATPase [Conexibacter sp. CPCC 206217]